VASIIDIVLAGTGDANQVCDCPYPLDINYDKISLRPTEYSVGDSKQTNGRPTITLIFKLELLLKNNTSLP
jgi:hypothetical protein